MKAFVLNNTGGIENLVEQNLPIPEIKEDEVLIKVKAISINPLDAVVRNNLEFLKFMLKLKDDENPIILGWDISGTITQIGSEVKNFKVGDEVFGGIKFPGHAKGYAEYVAAPIKEIVHKPKNISYEAAAAATLAALTAYQSLVTYAKVKPGDKVLIHAAAGGVGHYAVQIAKHLGAYVIGTGSEESKDFILSLEADEFINYKTQKFEDVVKDADVVLDSITMSPEHIQRSLHSLKNGGRLISLLAFFDDEFTKNMKTKNVYGHRLSVGSNGNDMKTIANWLENGFLKSSISKVFTFDELPLSHKQIETGRTQGKIIVKI